MDLTDLSATTIGVIVFGAIMCFVMWHYYNKEKKQNDFLQDRIRDYQAEQKLLKSKRQEKLEQELEDLGNPMSYEDLMQKTYLASFVSLILFGVVLGFYPIGIFLAVISIKIPDIYISILKDKRLEKFQEQLPVAIDQLYSVIQAGQTPQQGYAAVAAEQPYPIGNAFKKLSMDIKTGASQETALKALYAKYPINDIKLFQTGMLIASEATDAVAMNTLKTISTTIRTRASQKKSAKSTIMQGKYTAIILAMMPIVAFVGIETAMPEYMNDFLATTIGKLMITGAAILDGIGYFVASKITSTSSIVKY